MAAAVEKLGAPEKTQVVGNPVRPEVFEKAGERDAIRAQLGAGDRTVILSFGGSLGARRVNEVVADLCAWEQKNKKPVLHLHATGQYGVQLFQDLEKEKGFAPGESLVVKEYINNMPELLAAADLVISRAGALTLAELEAVGRAAVLIPSPNVAENHQYYNAMELQKAGAAVVIEEKDLTGEKLVSTVSDMLAQPGKLAEMGKNARFAHPRELGNRANGQAFQPDMGCQIERCLDNRGLGLLTFGERAARRPDGCSLNGLPGANRILRLGVQLARLCASLHGPALPLLPRTAGPMRRIPGSGRSGGTGNGRRSHETLNKTNVRSILHSFRPLLNPSRVNTYPSLPELLPTQVP